MSVTKSKSDVSFDFILEWSAEDLRWCSRPYKRHHLRITKEFGLQLNGHRITITECHAMIAALKQAIELFQEFNPES